MLTTDMEGKDIPTVTFRCRSGDQWVDRTSDELFKGKNVIVFSLPGAFTPTCSTAHVPRYNELYPTFCEAGVDSIVCMSVNDGFVMEAWQNDQQAPNIEFIADGNGQFTEGMGMLVDKSDLGFGKRSWRYSMLVRDGKVEKMFVEPDKPGDPFEVSDADTMLKYLAPTAKEPEFATVFTKPGCPHCARAKRVLTENGIAFEEVPLGAGVTSRTLRAVTGASTSPQVFIGGQRIGGADDLEAYIAQRKAA
jgi:glutaredoxin-like protein